MNIHDATQCQLGEGPLWHPERQSLFWFDIMGQRLHGEARVREFEMMVSAAGWIDRDTLLVASEASLFTYNLETGTQHHVAALEADNPVTRSNDGRADPFGGFWIGTMGKQAQAGAGAIHRYYRGKVTQLFDGITISNAICFAPDGSHAYYTDTPTRQIMRVTLDDEGWPQGRGEVFVDTNAEGWNPDGAVVAADGTLWVAHWGAAQIAQYDTQGRYLDAVKTGARHVTCPAFGGADFTTLFATSATQDLDDTEGTPDGKTLVLETQTTGQREHQVIL